MMSQILSVSWVVLVLCVFVAAGAGCDGDGTERPAAPDQTSSSGAMDDNKDVPEPDDPEDPPITYSGPPFELSIEVMESMPEQYAAAWKVTANTGGWKLTTDEVKHNGTLVEVYVTLEKPGPGEMVTMALETHRGRHDAGTDEIAGAELYVRFVVRGSNEESDHQLAARAPQ